MYEPPPSFVLNESIHASEFSDTQAVAAAVSCLKNTEKSHTTGGNLL
jgi:hypothetical protein